MLGNYQKIANYQQHPSGYIQIGERQRAVGKLDKIQCNKFVYSNVGEAGREGEGVK